MKGIIKAHSSIGLSIATENLQVQQLHIARSRWPKALSAGMHIQSKHHSSRKNLSLSLSVSTLLYYDQANYAFKDDVHVMILKNLARQDKICIEVLLLIVLIIVKPYSLHVMLWIFLAGSGIDEDDEINASDSDSDMEMQSADESTEMQELCDDICAEYLPECGLGGETDSESD